MQSLGVLKEWVAIGFLNTNPFFFAKYKNQNMNQSHLFSPHPLKERTNILLKVSFTKPKFYSTHSKLEYFIICNAKQLSLLKKTLLQGRI